MRTIGHNFIHLFQTISRRISHEEAIANLRKQKGTFYQRMKKSSQKILLRWAYSTVKSFSNFRDFLSFAQWIVDITNPNQYEPLGIEDDAVTNAPSIDCLNLAKIPSSSVLALFAFSANSSNKLFSWYYLQLQIANSVAGWNLMELPIDFQAYSSFHLSQRWLELSSMTEQIALKYSLNRILGIQI